MIFSFHHYIHSFILHTLSNLTYVNVCRTSHNSHQRAYNLGRSKNKLKKGRNKYKTENWKRKNIHYLEIMEEGCLTYFEEKGKFSPVRSEE